MRKLFLISLIFFALSSFAQQGLQMEFTELDSAQMKLQRQIEYYQLISGNTMLSGLMDDDLTLPDFDQMSAYQNQYTLNLSIFPAANYTSIGISSGMISPIYSPFYGNAYVLSAAAYQLSDKFTLGGFSYGTNSIFSAPNNGMNNFDSYGSTLFMEYKVSKKFKIETRVNVQQGGHHPPGF